MRFVQFLFFRHALVRACFIAEQGTDMIPSFSEELEVEVESVEKPKIYFSGKVYCRREMDMITAFFWRIRGSEG